MINLKKTIYRFIFFLSLTSCSSFPSNNIAPGYQEAFVAIGNFISGYEESIINKDLIDKIPYASSALKIGKGPTGLIILESKRGSKYTWVRADGIYIVIADGRIIQTAGLVNNLTNLVDPFSGKNFLKEFDQQEVYKYYQSYDKPLLKNMELEVTIKKEAKESIDIYGNKMELQLYTETKVNKYIGWNSENKYWVDEDFFVWKSVQNISPKIPKIIIEVTKKPSI